jgi:hypothetical protein
VIVILFLHPSAVVNMYSLMDGCANRTAADEYCSVLQMNRKLNMEGATILASFIGLPSLDRAFLSPDGRNCTNLMELCQPANDHWDDGLCQGWTLDGWVLEPPSWRGLQTSARLSMFRALYKKIHRFSKSRCFQKGIIDLKKKRKRDNRLKCPWFYQVELNGCHR